MDGHHRTGVGGQNCDGALLTARPLSGHAHPVRRQRAPPQAMVDRSEPRHVSQLHCGSDHDLGRYAGDPHGQTTTWSRYTPILTVALSDRPTRAGPTCPPRSHATDLECLVCHSFPRCLGRMICCLGLWHGRPSPCAGHVVVAMRDMFAGQPVASRSCRAFSPDAALPTVWVRRGRRR